MIEDVERIAEFALEFVLEADRGFDRILPATGPGTHRPSKIELMQFVAQVSTQYPPMWIVRPDGTQVFASPYILAMGETENGRALLKRIQSMQEEV